MTGQSVNHVVIISSNGYTVCDRRQVGACRVGDYFVLNTLGVGTFGKVKLAEQVVTKEKVVLAG
ncbi:hypothetical protein Pmar_PMAR016481 [Perkinsus marinus ATCC 50983]|uniref:Protein kinase domain-containing protein n=1 Tax=Perkinsus marinus (strain ATCC 50983 / TXsc) TaxID=423536 RepID=C5LNE0_PERM5|nr:hypothetical protein Pmar_PMAR016481 [Perkinsus marinus ATCC 50983]EER01752.1 hypothetical protein Pmar_PMAR016481 [Perkinsus marinus ATCC 50983]|eukprot:XP_002769034.1 hypothetical protein Pmar_PMAR016481 [Perkinsus marinus ATCC 50983]